MSKHWFRRLFSSTPAPAAAPDVRERAAGGDASAQFFLGLQCSSVEGPGQDLAQAVHWYRLAAEQDHRLAQVNLGVMLEQGQGTEKDPAGGRRWNRRAADAGDAGAQFNCGNHCYREMVTHRESNVAALRIEAYMWFELAALQGYRGSDASRNRVTVMMNHAEVAEANQRVAQFAPTVAPAVT